MTAALVSFTCTRCGPVTVEVPLERPTLVALGCNDRATAAAIGHTGRDLHNLAAHEVTV